METYLWLKALHIIAVIAWMAGLLYLPRIYVYHAETPVGSPQSETFKVMERKLLRFIILPAALATLVFGIGLLSMSGFLVNGWLHAKLTLVLGLLVFTHVLGRWNKAFAQDRNKHSAKFYRMVNEIPTVLMILIVILVVVKPF